MANNESSASMGLTQQTELSHQEDQEGSIRVLTETVSSTHNAIKAEDLSILIGSRCLLSNTELKIAEQSYALQKEAAAGSRSSSGGACYGLVGVNGCGKSTLLKLLSERRLPVPASWNVFLVSQHLPTPIGRCPVEEVLSADSKRLEVLKELQSLEIELAACTEGDEESLRQMNDRLLELHNEASQWDGAEKEIIEILVSLGFRGAIASSNNASEPSIRTPMNILSGGWRMKVQLAKALWLQPKLMLLDEPSNHLDFHALEWLQERLQQYPHTIVVVSHDVAFLHNVCKDILWMKDQKIESLPHHAVSQEDLLRMQRRRALNIRFSIPKDSEAENQGLSLHGVEFSYGGSASSGNSSCLLKVKKEIRFSGKSRSVLLGRNGSGKSTFLDLCAGKLSPAKGCIDRTPELKIGHYSQLTDDLDRNSTESAATYLARECSEELAYHGGSTRSTRLRGAVAAQKQVGDATSDSKSNIQKQLAAKTSAQHKRLLEIARGYLSSFGFDGDVAVSVPVDRLSGGQKALLKFAVLSLRPVHILLLDEPTNHLDAEACEALANGLSAFEGGIVVVTHDELLMYRLIHCNWTASELLICRGGSVWRERNFGAHCLNALKNEVHRAERDELHMKSESEQKLAKGKQTDQIPVKATEGEVPPWLRTRRRRKDCNNDSQVNEPNMSNRKDATADQNEGVSACMLMKKDQPRLQEDTIDSDATTEAPEVSDGKEESSCLDECRVGKDWVNSRKGAKKTIRKNATACR
jgi:ATPase subunit of ABC transporter with duplicated ATPase domains